VTPPSDWEDELAATHARVPEFMGLSRSDAQALADRLGLELRVITPDNQDVTADLRPRRMTVLIDRGTVSRAFSG
jgi:hypothetical protein